jgi:hypothetical protein
MPQDDETLQREKKSAVLPPRLRLLCVSPQEPTWVSLSLQLDGAGCVEPQFRWVSASAEALAILRDDSFDCVLICDRRRESSTTEAEPDLVSLSSAIRGSGYDEAVILVTRSLDDNRWASVCCHDCEVLITPSLWDSPALVPLITRAIRRVELCRENHRLAVSNHRRLIRERDEAEHLLKQQRQIISELTGLADSKAVTPATRAHQQPTHPRETKTRFSLPAEIDSYYHQLLRTYVIMGSGSLGSEIAKLADLVCQTGLTPRETLELHLERVECLVRGLGSRSTRHVLARADLLALELMIHLGECYQKQSWAA